MTDRMSLLQAWLALEHEAIWLYGLIGGRVNDLDEDAAKSWDRHRDVRDRLVAVIGSTGEVPIAPSMGYEPTTIDSVGSARRAAQSVENRIASACVAALASDADRGRALKGLTSAARAAVMWGATPEAFPGLD
jgi:hypothetical protein